jgi:hypothetical protein
VVAYGVALASLYGHDPREVREWPYRDVERLMLLHHTMHGGY